MKKVIFEESLQDDLVLSDLNYGDIFMFKHTFNLKSNFHDEEETSATKICMLIRGTAYESNSSLTIVSLETGTAYGVVPNEEVNLLQVIQPMKVNLAQILKCV